MGTKATAQHSHLAEDTLGSSCPKSQTTTTSWSLPAAQRKLICIKTKTHCRVSRAKTKQYNEEKGLRVPTALKLPGANPGHVRWQDKGEPLTGLPNRRGECFRSAVLVFSQQQHTDTSEKDLQLRIPSPSAGMVSRLNQIENQMCFCQGNQVKCSHEVSELLQPCLLHEGSSTAAAASSSSTTTFTIAPQQQLLPWERQASRLLRPSHFKCKGEKNTSPSLKRTRQLSVNPASVPKCSPCAFVVRCCRTTQTHS